jgi:predicted AlkP superfamily pyrophosphatase or phosphodiesterase
MATTSGSWGVGQRSSKREESQPLCPDYEGLNLSSLSPAILDRKGDLGERLPEELRAADQVVLVVLDGVGWMQLSQHKEVAPFLWSTCRGPISSVAPTTTATALTSITTGLRPCQHGVVGYRVAVAPGVVMNVLRWSIDEQDARNAIPPENFQPQLAFGGRPVPVVTRAEFAQTGFSAAHLRGSRLVGWRVPSTLVAQVQDLLADKEEFIYVYYDGVDKVAHEFGLGRYYQAELGFADRLVAELAGCLPRGAALAVTSDHGQVEVGERQVVLEDDVVGGDVIFSSGEGRFRWLHVKDGRLESLRSRLEEAVGQLGWVLSKEDLEGLGVFGGPLPGHVAERLGDLAILAREPVAFVDPADTGELRLVSRHGSLTEEEVWVPFCVASA